MESTRMTVQTSLVQQASLELELLRPGAVATCSVVGVGHGRADLFPMACRKLVRSLPGNTHCVDCGAPNPAWASVSYGCLLCLRCSGKHRSFGVQTSKVRSIDMDHWTHDQVLAMLEGGNAQILQFFDRHCMGNAHTQTANNRYHTKASLFYRTHLSKHVESVASAGTYQGREASRRSTASSAPSSTFSSSPSSSSQASSSSHYQKRAAQQMAHEGASSRRLLPVAVQMC